MSPFTPAVGKVGVDKKPTLRHRCRGKEAQKNGLSLWESAKVLENNPSNQFPFQPYPERKIHSNRWK